MMPKGIRPGTEMRCELLQKLLVMGMSNTTIGELIEPMYNKPDEVKERIAADILAAMEYGELEEYLTARGAAAKQGGR